MALLIAHGLPKSGSTFLFQVAKDVAASINGLSHYQAKAAFFPGMDVPDFVQQPDDEFIRHLVERLPRGAAYVVKTHGAMTPLLKSAIAAGDIRAVVSFRDVRDTIISMLDAGESDRRKGANRFFGTLHRMEDAIGPARHGWRVAREWVRCEGALPIPYYLTACDQNTVIRKICDYMGASRSFYSIFPRYLSNKASKITEFHKGVADRFLDDLPPHQVVALTRTFSEMICENDLLTEHWMNAYGYRLLYQKRFYDRQAHIGRLMGSE